MKKSAHHKTTLVYMAVNIHNGHSYIGITTHKDIMRRESEHFSAARRDDRTNKFYKAIREFGRTAFEWFTLMRCETVAAAEEMEVYLIAAWKPEYNGTRGGNYRPPLTEAGRERLRKAHRGKQYRLGIKHSDRARSIISRKAKQQWAEGRARRKPLNEGGKCVVCLDNGRMFESASEAARVYNLSRSQVIMVCLRQVATAGGFVFRYFGDHYGGPDEAMRVKVARKGTVENRPIICLNDKIVYQTNKEAKQAYGIGRNTIYRACHRGDGKATLSGLAFMFLDEWCPNPL